MKMRFNQFVEIIELKNTIRIVFTQEAIAKEFFELLKKCANCDIDNIKIDTKSILAKYGFCTSGVEVKEMLFDKLDNYLKNDRLKNETDFN